MCFCMERRLTTGGRLGGSGEFLPSIRGDIWEEESDGDSLHGSLYPDPVELSLSELPPVPPLVPSVSSGAKLPFIPLAPPLFIDDASPIACAASAAACASCAAFFSLSARCRVISSSCFNCFSLSSSVCTSASRVARSDTSFNTASLAASSTSPLFCVSASARAAASICSAVARSRSASTRANSASNSATRSSQSFSIISKTVRRASSCAALDSTASCSDFDLNSTSFSSETCARRDMDS
mmetsp:Transcript_5727/g.11195  ORF Transcript_5727/g.11195 Transcript_5727/m.11195 type:complete len:240 (-) Transcript_5727:381-1100(-)